ncbi:hypothetical protein ACHAWX_005228 [Stephanocyclus meneghinianus]
MKLNLLAEWLSWFEYQQECNSSIFSTFEDYGDTYEEKYDCSENRRKFMPEKDLCERDNLIIDMLNSASSQEGSTTVSFCVTDPNLPDNPVIYVSDGFCHLTGYEFDEVVGKNCRFLQGPETKREDIIKIVNAIKEEKECTVRLLNYRKDGTTFSNEVRCLRFHGFVFSILEANQLTFIWYGTLQFYLAQLRSPAQEVVYFIGIQAAVDVVEGGKDRTLCVTDILPSNPGMKYSISSSQIAYSSHKQSWQI